MRSDPTRRLVFFIGTGRCGSSLVHEILARHPDVGFVSNIDDRLAPLRLLGRHNNSIYRRTPEALTRKSRPRFAPSEAYRLLDREVSPVVSDPFRDLMAADATPWLVERFRAFFTARMEAQGAPVFTHKFTGWPRVGFIRAAFPDAKIIHVVRDGRAVANSWLQMSWWDGYRGVPGWRFGPLPAEYQQEWDRSNRSHVLLAGIAWKLLLDAIDASRAQIAAEDWLELRYEDLLNAPDSTMNAVLAHCEIEMHPSLRGYLETNAPNTRRRASYLTDLDPASLELLNISLGDHLSVRGYDTAAA